MLINDLFENSIDPEQQKMDLIRAGRLSREREPAGSDAIDAQLAANNNARQQYAETGNFWLKQKDTQQHLNDQPYTGKAAANAAALELLKQQPELRGNLVVTAYGPGETQGVAEGPNDGKEDNFTIDDIKNLERIRDLETLKAQAKELIKGKPARRMKPEKISWFYNHIDTLKNPLAVIKMMYDLMLAGEGNKVIGSRNSMSSNSYRSKFGEQGVAEGAPELLKKEMPLHRHAEKLLAQNGVSKDDPDYYHHLGNTIKHLRQFGNIDLINKQGVAEGSGGNWYIRVNGKILNDTKFKPVIFSSEDEARSHAMKLADKKRIPLSQMKLTKSWMDAPEQGVAEGGYSGIDDTDTVGFSVNSERAYNAVMARFGDQIDHDETSGILYVPARMWPKVEMVAFDADGEGAVQADGLDEGEKVGNMDADKFDDAIARLKKLAGAGPMKTVYDPNKRVYRNVPTAVQPGTKK